MDDHDQPPGDAALANLVIALVVVIVGTQMHHISLLGRQVRTGPLVSILGGAVFLSIGQALVGLVKSSDSVNAAGRLLMIGLILPRLSARAGRSAAPGSRSPAGARVGIVMTLFAGVLNLSAWDHTDTLTLVAAFAYIVVFAGIGIRWFQWDAR